MRPLRGRRRGEAQGSGASLWGALGSGGSRTPAPPAACAARPHDASDVRKVMLKLPETGLGIDAYVVAREAAGLPVILDLGCGARKVDGAFGIDIAALPGVDVVHDLERRPYRLPESGADGMSVD